VGGKREGNEKGLHGLWRYEADRCLIPFLYDPAWAGRSCPADRDAEMSEKPAAHRIACSEYGSAPPSTRF
jgi:hypothetical protein